MVHEKKVILEASDWLRVYDDGSIDRTWSGAPEFNILLQPVLPHDHFIEGFATKDVITDKTSGHRVQIYLPERNNGETNHKLPVMLHFNGGGFCICEEDWYMYYHTYTKVAREANAIVISVYLRQALEDRFPAQLDDSFYALSGFGLWLKANLMNRG